MPTAGHSEPRFLVALEEALISREARIGFQLLDDSEAAIVGIDMISSSALKLLLCIAQWIDLGYTKTEGFDRLYGAAGLLATATLPLVDFLRWQLIQAFRTSSHENINQAMHHLKVVQLAGKASCPRSRRQGEYEHALENTKSAQAIASDRGVPRLVSLTKIHESWLVSQRGEQPSRCEFQ